MMHSSFKYFIMCLAALTTMAGCCLIDEDISDCKGVYRIDYQIEEGLYARMDAEIAKELGGSEYTGLAESLRGYMGGIFSDMIHGMDLSFYEAQADSISSLQDVLKVEALKASYTFSLPAGSYMHLAYANVGSSAVAVINDGEYCHKARLEQPRRDTVPSHKSGLFTCRLPLELLERETQEFSATLYMANCAVALVADTLGSHIKDLKMFGDDFADGFQVCDSTYTFSPVVVRSDVIPSGPGLMCLATVNFPSRDNVPTRDVSNAIWEVKVYAKCADGSITETVLGFIDPLPAGTLKIIKAKVMPDGSVVPEDSTVGVSVTLDWHTGYSGEIDL